MRILESSRYAKVVKLWYSEKVDGKALRNHTSMSQPPIHSDLLRIIEEPPLLPSKASPPHRLLSDEGAMLLEQMKRIESPLEVEVNEGLSVCATDLDQEEDHPDEQEDLSQER